MKTGSGLPVVLIFICSHWISAQTLQNSVIGSSGDTFISSQGSLAWTLGEILSETYSEKKGYLTQGFHQPLMIRVTGLQELEDGTVKIYPNPVRDFLSLEFSHHGQFTIELLNLQGQRLVNEQKSIITKDEVHQIDMKDFAVALYLLRISNAKSGQRYNIRIEKY